MASSLKRLPPLLATAALIAVPAMAQTAADTAPATVTPPSVVRTIDPAATQDTSSVPVDPDAAAQAAAEDAANTATRRATHVQRRAAAPRRTAVRRVVAAAPAAVPVTSAARAAPTPAPAASTVASAPTASPTPATVPAATSVQPAAQSTQQTTTERHGMPSWPFALLAVLVVAALATFLLRRRRDTTVWDEDSYAVEPAAPVRVEPVDIAPFAAEPTFLDRADPAAVAPLAISEPGGAEVTDAAPVAAESAIVDGAEAGEVAALTAGSSHDDRPWLEFGLRPTRAGTNVDEALVEVELTVGNAGALTAADVRISTFMLAAGNDSELQRLLLEPIGEGATAAVDIAPGEGTRVDATLAMNRAALIGDAEHTSFRPVIVADARYRLPTGEEGRTSAAFLIGGVGEDGALEPIALDRTMLREDVGAELYRAPEHV